MKAFFNRSPGHTAAALAAGVLLTFAAVALHRFLPERRLTLQPLPDASNYYLTKGDEAATRVTWLDQQRLHFKCHFAVATSGASCGYTFLLFEGKNLDQGVDLSRFRDLNLSIRYAGAANYLRVAIRDFDPAFSRPEDWNSTKFNTLNLEPHDLAQPVAISLREFTVPEWWSAAYHLPRRLSQPDMSNAIALSLYLQGEAAGTEHDVQIEKIEFTGHWISAEYWYLGILCAWMLAAASYGTSQWLYLRRRHVALKSEKDHYKQLSTIDGLTKVLNRHGVEQFLATVEKTLPTSIIVIDLDHFKKINDNRGHYTGDRVLQTVGEVLRMHTRHTDGLGRWGGEEFILVCPGATLAKASDLAEKLRHRILQTNFIPEDPLSVTASFGVATSPAGGSFDEAFQQADQALYLAKSRGRNCVVAAGDEQMHKVTGARKGTWALISGRFKLHK